MTTPEWLDTLDASERDALRRRDVPQWTEPMLATLTDEHFSAPDWIYERKLDGVRCLAFRRGDTVAVRSRSGRALDATYPELHAPLRAQPPSRYVADGEIVAFDGKVTSFARLQGRMGLTDPDAARASGIAVYLYLFDLLHLDGFDLTALPLRRRKALLRSRFTFDDPIRFTPHRNAEGEAFFAEACRKGWEGVIAKRADAPYVHARSRDWLKFKCVHRQELVVGGWTDPEGSRTGFGALLLGYHDDDGALRYAGRVGTGFDEETLASLHDRLERLARETSPYAAAPDGDDVHWVRPELVVEVGFTEWTEAGRLRHPRFLGVRRDKPAADVVRERPA